MSHIPQCVQPPAVPKELPLQPVLFQPSSVPAHGGLLLHSAAQWGLVKMVARQVELQPESVNAPDTQGWTPLMLASSRGHIAVVAWLLEHGACPHTQDLDGFTALTHAATGRRGKPEVLRMLLERGGADPNVACAWGSTPLMEAAALGFEERVRVLLALHPRERKGGEGEAEKKKGDRGEKIRRRVEGVDVNMQDGKGSTALLKACLYGRVTTVNLLLEAGADPTLHNHEGLSPMLATLPCPHDRGMLITRLLEHAMLEPCRIRYLLKARFLVALSSTTSPLSSSSSSSSSSRSTRTHSPSSRTVPPSPLTSLLPSTPPSPLLGATAGGASYAQLRLNRKELAWPRVEVHSSSSSSFFSSSSSSSSLFLERTAGAIEEEKTPKKRKMKVEEEAEEEEEKEEENDEREDQSHLTQREAEEEEKQRSVLSHVLGAGFSSACMDMLVEMMLVPWDPMRRGREVGVEGIETGAKATRAWVERHRGEVAGLRSAREESRRRKRRRREAEEEGGWMCEDEVVEGEEALTTGDEEEEEEEEEEDDDDDDERVDMEEETEASDDSGEEDEKEDWGWE